jgi:hypothetical protein
VYRTPPKLWLRSSNASLKILRVPPNSYICQNFLYIFFYINLLSIFFSCGSCHLRVLSSARARKKTSPILLAVICPFCIDNRSGPLVGVGKILGNAYHVAAGRRWQASWEAVPEPESTHHILETLMVAPLGAVGSGSCYRQG